MQQRVFGLQAGVNTRSASRCSVISICKGKCLFAYQWTNLFAVKWRVSEPMHDFPWVSLFLRVSKCQSLSIAVCLASESFLFMGVCSREVMDDWLLHGLSKNTCTWGGLDSFGEHSHSFRVYDPNPHF